MCNKCTKRRCSTRVNRQKNTELHYLSNCNPAGTPVFDPVRHIACLVSKPCVDSISFGSGCRWSGRSGLRGIVSALRMFPHLSIPSAKTLADYTSPDLVIPELTSRTPSSIIAELCLVLRRQGCLNDATAFYDAVLAREFLSPTSMTCGWAMPHGRLKDLPRLCFTVGRLAQPVRWLDHSGNPVRVILLFAVPERDTRSYLNLIAAVARLSQDSALVNQLRSVPDASGMLHVLERVQLPVLQPASVPAPGNGAGVFSASVLTPRS